jgi:hypothetical protein
MEIKQTNSTMNQMLSPFTYQSSSFIDYIYSNLKDGKCNVHMKDGSCYVYRNVSRRAILKLQLDKTVSLGFWFNRNIVGPKAKAVKVWSY